MPAWFSKPLRSPTPRWPVSTTTSPMRRRTPATVAASTNPRPGIVLPSVRTYVVPRSWNPAQTASITEPPSRARAIAGPEAISPSAASVCGTSSAPPRT